MVYLFLAEGFEEIEALAPVDFLRRAGVSVTTVAVGDALSVRGAHGIEVRADALLSQTDCSDGEMIVLPGGMPGTTHLDECPAMSEILASASARGAYLAAICAAPMVLGKRGYLNGRSAVCYPGFESELAGASISVSPVVRDGKMITAKSAGVAWQFAYRLAEALVGTAIAEQVRTSLFLPEMRD
ncbi:MAG: DJ-1/PfpI family protein [Clostridia bacterium]|nr:DJ-1/PfpI family protein [Clostridia bacterium]